ncbi:TIGR02680 family protein [Streptosporangium sp. NBC_01755]|uniref:TIGR02680 family protein n=1 Tax=unclassified Streptosporangium TaxID=2632669 RepID=UPI002DDB7B7B|nr:MULTISPECIES: TIGR02680 family protein [unclassified Streptosporangium]WSA23286.1 TIGR02680 family protein [Streptosporangium sp. NBC_01810]WSC98576.1 TIGR02680 family protein [Streptosporangium sp. NBC_01755]
MTHPIPTSERWKPLRAGLVDMFHYDVEEFRFHDGRLLLRGNNGTGKSKVLALTLPFLLDGELAPHRVEPDGDRQKRMEWNLLLGGRHPHPERLGYTWMEFGRRAADGTVEFRTIGCGMKAVKDRGIVRHWFFVTPQRVGAGLDLLSPTGVSLTREKLRDAVDGHGMVYDRAFDYRRAVDEALFGLGEHRYEALVNLLIQLRQPQLSKKPDERLLSRALTEALPPLSPSLISTVAEAFRGLDEEHDALRALEEARGAATDFLSHYRRYARIAAKRKAAVPRTAQSRYEHLSRDLNEAEGRRASAQGALEAARESLTGLAATRTRLEARKETLEKSPRMRDAERLTQVSEEAERQAGHSRVQENAREDLATEMRRRQARAEAAEARAAQAARELSAARESSASAARQALCERDHLDIVARWEEDPAGARRAAETLADRRSQAVAELDRLFEAVTRAGARLDAARAETDRLTHELQAAAERIFTAERITEEQTAELAGSYLGYLAGVVELRIDDPDAVLATLESWAVTAEGPNPAATAVDDAVRTATAELGRGQAELDTESRARRQAAADLAEEITRLEAGGHDAPPVPYTRAPGARADRPGAPLWKVVDFTETIPVDQRAGLEAALEAAGVLDAWVTPSGTLAAEDDTVLLAGTAVAGPSCSAVLRPAVDRADPWASALPDAAVHAVLAAIGLGPGAATWVAADGRWANGVLTGSWHKETAEHIGEGAREAARRARLARLRDELGQERERLEELRRELDAVAARQRALAEEHRALPSDTRLREAHVKLAGEHERRRELGGAHRAALGVVSARQAEVESARTLAGEFAGDVGLPTEAAELAAARTGVAGYRLTLAGLWPAAEAMLGSREAATETAEELSLTRERHSEAVERAARAQEGAEAAAEAYRVLVKTAGAAVEELYRHLDEVRQAMRERDAAERAARREEQTALVEQGKAEGTLDALRGEIEQAGLVRDAAIAEFRAFAATGLLRVAVPSLEVPDPGTEWAATPAVLLARAVNTELDGVDDADNPWDRVQKRVTEEHKSLSDAMARHGHSVGLTLRDGVMVVDVLFQGHTRDIPGLAEALSEETEHRAQLLSAKERELLENHLLNEVAGTLHEMIAAAETEVREMNAELESRPTSTGMRLRLLWKIARNAPDGLDRIREKLRQTVDAWSVEDRALVGAFLQEQIAGEYADNPAAGRTEQLTRALDYRTWHEFAIQRLQDGQWRTATGPASGGERVLAASMPLFAAASAHYKSAGNPHAPRLVALDEAFAGVDDDSRAKCLGLLATFDMDVVMTSEREWGCYPQVPGLAICQLSRHDGVDAVLVTTWRWDGRERRRMERPDPRPATVVPEQEPEGLFT